MEAALLVTDDVAFDEMEAPAVLRVRATGLAAAPVMDALRVLAAAGIVATFPGMLMLRLEE